MQSKHLALQKRGLLTRIVAVSVSSMIAGLQVSAAEIPPDIKQELERLANENKALKLQLEKQSGTLDQLMKRLESMEKSSQTGALKQQTGEAVPAGSEPVPDRDVVDELLEKNPLSKLNLRWFGDVNYRAGGKLRGGAASPNSFHLGQLDLMASSQLADKISVMSEVVFAYRDDESFVTTIERLQFQYSATDLINFRVGRTHTPFGYWNESYHHGSWFQTTALRPEILRFHDGGSVLPSHSVGVEMYGFQPVGDLGEIHYDIGVANGRGRDYTTTQNIQDANENKAVYGVISLVPAFVSGLRFGVNGYLDRIPSNPASASRKGDINEVILGAHAVLLHGNIEVLSEIDRIHHEDKWTGTNFDTWGMYTQVGYQWNSVKPYYRFDILDLAEGDPFYGPLIQDVVRHTMGVRWDFTTWAAFKLEYHYVDQTGLNTPHGFVSQATFTF